MDKEKDVRQILSGKSVEVPESLLPENIKNRILQMEQEGAFDSDRKKRNKNRSGISDAHKTEKSVHKKGHKFMPYIRAGAAVAAGLIICVLSGSISGSNLFMPDQQSVSTLSGMDEEGNVVVLTDLEEGDGYHLAYQSLQSLKKSRKEKENGGILDNLINGIGSTKKNKTSSQDVQVYYESSVSGREESENIASSATDSLQELTPSKSFSDTNVRTRGVNEGDIVKTDGDYIYEYVSGSAVCNIHQVDGATTKCVSEIRRKDFGVSIQLRDMYVSGDRLILLAGISGPNEKQIKKIYDMAGADYSNFNESSWEGYEYYPDYYMDWEEDAIAEGKVAEDDSDKKDKVKERIITYSLAYIFDISDRSKPKLQRMTFQDGGYLSSRMVGDELYLFSQRTLSMDRMKEDEPETFIPQVDGQCVKKGRICVPEDVQTANYSLISSTNVQTGETVDQVSVLGGASEVYVSGSNIYMLDDDGSYNKNGKTVITKLAYHDGIITKKATGKVKGYVDDDYALDEYKGYLRVVSTYYGNKYQERNAVYVLDEDLKVTGSIENIAKNEKIYSARFLGDIAYFVTYRQTDPLFTADLSDPKNPKIIGELKLPGFSDYLHPIGDHLLLGLGEHGDEDGDFEGLKLSLFDISDPVNVREIHKEVLPRNLWDAEAMHNPNALFLDEERGLLGFYAEGYDDSTYYEIIDEYFVYSFDEKKGFKRKLRTRLGEGTSYQHSLTARGLYIDDFFYIVSLGANQISTKGNEIISYDYHSFEHLKTNKSE